MWYSCTIARGTQVNTVDVADSVELGAGLVLEKVPDWVRNEEALDLLSWPTKQDVEDAYWCISARYEAEDLGTPDPDWSGKESRGIQDSVDEKFSLVSVALWLASPTLITCGPTFHFSEEGDPQSRRRFSDLRSVLVTGEEKKHQLSSEKLGIAKNVFESILALDRKSTCWMAVRLLLRATTEKMWEARYLLEWVVLEALFGPSSPGETTFRISQRIGFFVESEPESQESTFQTAKDAYSWRSKLVHGAKLSKLSVKKSRQLSSFIEATIRESLLRILTNRALVDLFNTKLREDYLDGLAYGRNNSEA